jgi:hypothetical protein
MSLAKAGPDQLRIPIGVPVLDEGFGHRPGVAGHFEDQCQVWFAVQIWRQGSSAMQGGTKT